jgi:hypothetical protein
MAGSSPAMTEEERQGDAVVWRAFREWLFEIR